MERLLSPAMHRRVVLLNVLTGATGWVTSDYLAERINCSKKTINLDCQYIEDRWSEYLTIETSKKHGIQLITSPHKSVHEIYSEIIQESNAFTLLESIFFHPNQQANYWENTLFLSNSSLYRLSKTIQTALNDRNIQLNRSPYYVDGSDERQVRYFFASYFIEVYGIRNWPFPLDQQQVFALTSKINKAFQLNLNDSQTVHLAYSIAVTLIRKHQGFFVKSEKEIDRHYLQHASEDVWVNEALSAIVQELDCQWDPKWLPDFYYSVFWWAYGWDNAQERRNIEHQAEQVIETIKGALEIPISEKSEKDIIQLIDSIYAKHKLFPYKQFMVYDRFMYSSRAIKHNLVVFTAVLKKAFLELEKKTKFPWVTMYLDNLLHEIAIRWQDLSKLTEERRHQVSVFVLSDLGKEHAVLLASFLEENFQNKIIITIQEQPFYDQLVNLPKGYDLYVSNYAIEEVDSALNIIVEDMPSFKNLVDLRKFIEQKRLILPRDIAYLRNP